MRNLRRQRLGGRTVLQTPIILLENQDDGRRAALVLTAHLGEPRYYQDLRALLEGRRGTIYFESVRSRDDAEAHGAEPYHRFLRTLREDIYTGLASVGPLVFQGQRLAPEPTWVNADVDCCELASRLRDERVPLAQHELSFAVLRRLIEKAAAGDGMARAVLTRSLKFGLVAVSLPFVFETASRLPKTNRLLRVINDWRSARAVACVASTPGDFTLIYGAAHGDGLLRGLSAQGFREVQREWLTVFEL